MEDNLVEAFIMAFSAIVFIIALTLTMYMFSKVTYTSEVLTANADTTRFYENVEMKNLKSRPEMVQDNFSIKDYDTVFIGFPIWWYTAPHIINTFIESNDFSGKKVVLFATSGSTGIEKTVNDLQKQYPDINIAGGKLVNRSFSEKDFDF